MLRVKSLSLEDQKLNGYIDIIERNDLSPNRYTHYVSKIVYDGMELTHMDGFYADDASIEIKDISNNRSWLYVGIHFDNDVPIVEVRSPDGVASDLHIPYSSLFGYCGSSTVPVHFITINRRHFALYNELEFVGFKYNKDDGVNDGSGLECFGSGLFIFNPSTFSIIQSLVDYMVDMRNKSHIDEYDGEKYYFLPLRGRDAVYRIKDYSKFKRALTKVVTLCRK